MDTKPVWRLNYATRSLRFSQAHVWSELWRAYVMPTQASVQGYWNFFSDIPVQVVDLHVTPVQATINETRIIVEV